MVGRTLRNYVLVCRCSFCNLQVEFCAFSLFHSTISGFFCRALSPDLSEELPFFCKVNVGSFPVLLSAVLGRPKENHGGNTALKFTKFLKDVEGSSGVFVWVLVLRSSQLLWNTSEQNEDWECQFLAVSHHKVCCHGNVPRPNS